MSSQTPPPFASPVELYRALKGIWSAETASPSNGWTAQDPAKNHCSVTSLIVHDYFDGDIVSTQTTGGTHFYNLIKGQRWDLTISQFAEPIPFADNLSTRDAAMNDTTAEKYENLAGKLRACPVPDSPA